MTEKKLKYSSKRLAEEAIKGLQEKKAEDIVLLNLKEIDNSICDYFIICTGTSNRHTDSLSDSVEEFVKKKMNEKPYHVEGKETSEWVLLDYVDVVIHIFIPEMRDFYNLEGLWADAKKIAVA
jgi:ribosome-associated protein